MKNDNPVQSFGKWLLSCLLLWVLASSAAAEDIEIFADELPPSTPNILFLLDQSGSMNISVSGTSQSRLGALRTAFNSVMSDPELLNIKVGLMGFSSGNTTPFPHGVSFPVSPIDDESTPLMLANLIPYGTSNTATVGYFTLDDDNLPNPVAGERVREFLPRILTSWNAWGNTPIVDAYYEAALYFRGEQPKWGLATPEQNHAAHPATYTGSSQGTVSQVTTGNTAVCNTPDCGINCAGFTEQDICPADELTCGLGTNCATATESWGEICNLGSEADCLASDPKYTSCETSNTNTCSTSCISGVYHPETGACLPNALNSFTIKTHAPNMCIEVNNNTVTQETCDGSTQQTFYSTEARPGYVQIHASNDNCFHVENLSTDNKAKIQAFGCYPHKPSHQVFQLSGGQIIADNSGKCLDIHEASEDSGLELEQYDCSGVAHQSFTISNEATSCTTNTTTLCQYPRETTRCDHQKYRCDETDDDVTLDSTAIVYRSPILDKCESNAIVILSDGEPIVRNQSQLDQTMTEIKTMAGLTTDCVGGSDGRCGPELARFLATEDQNTSIDGDNTVNTYTIGFDVAQGSKAETFLTSVAKAGGGGYFPASNAAALANVFKSVILDVSKTARSYAAPVYTVDPSSHLAHSRDVYIPLFENSSTPRWSGNLKKFKLNDDGQIVGRNNQVATDASGVLDPTVLDFWSDAAAGATEESNPVTSGGVANRLTPATRNLLTDNGSTLLDLDSSSVSKQALSGGGATISDDLYEALLKFIQGFNEDGTARNHIGDILHNKPAVVAYADKEVVFFGTNEGYLHAINTADASDTSDGGKELFAFMPSPLLANVQGQYTNIPLTGQTQHLYGVDGEMTVWIKDDNKNGKVDTNESAHLYFGLRRGGNAYYAMDISDPTQPSLLWTINQNTPGFEGLGQTWSKPAMGKLQYKDLDIVKFEEVLVFGGGYDAAVYDEEDTAVRDNSTAKGNSIYVVNAKTGKLIWSHRGGALKDSVPSNINVLDVDRNGSIDRLYFGDVGGNVWRVDLNVDDIDDDISVHDVTNDARIYKFAQLGTSASGSDVRKFFYEPDVSLFKHKGRIVSLVSIGSGYRSHPSNTDIADRMFVLYDENAMNVPKVAPQTPLIDTDLAASSSLAGKDFLPNHKGWYIDLAQGKGEKSLSSPLLFRDKLMFTTFGLTNSPVNVGGVGSCTSQTNNLSRAYVLDMMTGAATVDLNGDGTITDEDIATEIGFGEIPDTPKPVFNPPSNCTDKGCDHNIDIRVGRMEKPLIDSTTVGGDVNLGDYLPRVFWLEKEH